MGYNLCMKPTAIVAVALILSVTSCKKLQELDPRGEKEHEGKMMKGALKDFWHFSTDDDQGKTKLKGESPRKDVWRVKDMSTKHRARALVDVDAEITLSDKILKDKGFRLARHLMIDTRASIVRVRFWSRGFRDEGGMFAELILSKDGKSWSGSKRGADKAFQFIPGAKAWKKLTKDEIKIIKTISFEKKRAIARGHKDYHGHGIRDAAAKLKIEPAKLSSLEKSIHRMFYHPRTH